MKSHPQGNDIKYTDENGNSHLMATWLPKQINDIFADIDISIAEKEIEKGYALYTLNISYKNNKVENFDYSFWDGTDWSNIVSARNGIGLIELFGVASDAKQLKLKAEYIFEGEARIDRELEDVLKKIDPVPFRNSYYTISHDKKPKQNKPLKSDIAEAPLTEVSTDFQQTYKADIANVINGIKAGKYESVQPYFTAQGYDIFNRLITYGNAKVIGNPELRFIKFEDKVICRSVPMSFNFKSNNKQFIENVVFEINNEGKIDNLSFGLSGVALNDIVKKDVWNERDRMILVSFLENYKTAYALKRLEYIEQIFADDALIITGTLVKVKPSEVNRYKGNRIIQYNRQSKEQYIKNLKYSFESKEYINLKFEESKIRKAGKGGDIYGVQIKQNYFSSNYGDVGYLFLMVDLNNPDEPVIHVRTWQPELGPNDSVYGLSDFN